ncbi:MAG TPA: hypothetical protein VFR32_07485 [Gaiellaceae bacterium]|nr:hypothetical protein [Gaiellaceae bacterium]
MSNCGADRHAGSIGAMELTGRMLVLAAVVVGAALSLPAVAFADDRDVRKAGACTASSEIEIRLRAEKDVIRIELEIEAERPATSWSLVVLHERRIAFRGVIRARSGSRTARLRRTVDDYLGRDSIVVRASGPRLESCRVSAAV